MKTFIILVLSIVAFTSCTQSSTFTAEQEEHIKSMQESIVRREAFIDRADEIIPFMDTIGEGDDYYDMEYARDMFERAHTYEGKCNAFQDYEDLYQKVHDETIKLIEQKSEREWDE